MIERKAFPWNPRDVLPGVVIVAVFAAFTTAPIFADDYILSVRSPAKRAGIPGNLWNDNSDRSGADIGASR